MKPKKKNINTQEISKEYMDRAVDEYERSSSMREAARALDISPMKLRKILITADVFESGVSKEIKEMYSSGMSIEDIARYESMTVSNVYSYLPYERVVYNLDEKSVNADKQARYRDRCNQEECVLEPELIAWLERHSGIVADLRRRAGLEKV